MIELFEKAHKKVWARWLLAVPFGLMLAIIVIVVMLACAIVAAIISMLCVMMAALGLVVLPFVGAVMYLKKDWGWGRTESSLQNVIPMDRWEDEDDE